MDVLGDAIARERRSDSIALSAPAVGRCYDYRRFCTSAWKVGNFLSYIGVRSGAGVAIADDPLPEPVLTLYGAAALGAIVEFDPPASVDAATRAVVAPTAEIGPYSVGPETKRVAYGDPPEDPSISYFERDIWSENPTPPPDRVDPDDPLFRIDDRTYTHETVLEAARAVIDHRAIEADSVVAVRGPFADPSVAVAGLIAPIVAGARLSIGPEAGGTHVVDGSKNELKTLGIE